MGAKNLLKAVWRYFLTFVVLGGIWQVMAVWLGDAVLPSPLKTLALFIRSFADSAYLSNMAVSLWRLFLGLLAATVIAFPLGLLLGHHRKSDTMGSPFVFITYPIPKIVFLPVFFVMFGLGDLSRVVLIALTTGYQILVIVRATAQSLDPVYEDALAFMGGNRADRIRHVYLPAALPHFLTSLKVASGTAIAVLFMAESFATTSGLGYLIMDAWGMGDTLAMFNGILGMCFLGLLLYFVIWCAEKVLCPWNQGAH